MPQRDPEKTKTDPRTADALASPAGGRLAGAGHVRRLFVRRPIARSRAQSLPDRVVRAGQPVLPARRVACRRAAHRPRGSATPGAARRWPEQDYTGAGQEQARARHRERQMSLVQHLYVRSPDQALWVVQ